MGFAVPLLCLSLGAVFLASALPKMRHPKGFMLAVLEYRVLPPLLGRWYARMVPPLELFLALLMLAGTAVRAAAAAMALLLVSFVVAVGINLRRGRDLDCHCFGERVSRPIGPGLLLQDVALLGAAGSLAVVVRSWLTPEPWSVFRIGDIHVAGVAALLVCAALTAGAWGLLARPWPAAARSVPGAERRWASRTVAARRR